MKAIDLIKDLLGGEYPLENNPIDTIKEGDIEKEIKKVATCFIITPEVIRQAHSWGADLIITHEPTYYNHYDFKEDENPVVRAKSKLINETDIAIFRYHNFPHDNVRPDIIHYGFVKTIGLEDCFNMVNNHITLPKSTKPLDFAKQIKEKLNLSNLRITGTTDKEIKEVWLVLGHPGPEYFHTFVNTDNIDALIIGEGQEWSDFEYVRDSVELGYNKTLFILGHCGAEFSGMRYLAEKLTNDYNQLEIKYFESNEPFIYLN